jgi:solute carrier family 25 protein 34/35
MNPIDVVRTRFYDQTYVNNVGANYNSGFDAIKKIFNYEGPSAFYKGLTTHFLRIGPHFCCNTSIHFNDKISHVSLLGYIEKEYI